MESTLQLGLQLGISIIGLMIIVGLIPLKKVPAYLGVLILLFILGPVLYTTGKNEAQQYLAGPHNWWEYIVMVIVVLVILRLLLDFVMPWRKKK